MTSLFAQKSIAEEHILILNSYHPQYIWSSEQVKGIEDVLGKNIHLENIHVEYLDSRRFIDDILYKQYLLDLIDYKYKKHYDISLVMVNEDFALNFALENRNNIFKNIPIVFSGVNADFSEKLLQHDNVTGIYEGIDIKGNIELMLRVQPNAKKIILITDTTSLGTSAKKKSSEVIAHLKKEKVYNNIEFEIWDDYSFHELKNRLSTLPDKSAALMLVVQQDNTGRYFSYQKDLRTLSENSSSPLYGLWGTLVLDKGILGGNMISPYLHGKNAAHIAVKILQGTPASNIPIVHMADYRPYFDYTILKRFGISTDILPEESVIINEPKRSYQRLLKRFIITCTISTLLFILSLILLYNTKKRKEAERKLHILAYNDSLTGLPNKNSFIKHISQLDKRKPKNYLFALLDITGFRFVNERLGYKGGNTLLKKVAERLLNNLPGDSFVGRFSADEFYVVCDREPYMNKNKLTDLIQEVFNEPFLFECQNIALRVNIGILSFPEDVPFVSQIVNYLEATKNEAKKRVDINTIYFDKSIPKRWRHQTLVESKIRNALAENKFFISYQPKISINQESVVGAEGLIRMWDNDKNTIIYPNDFIEVAEESYLIQRINICVIDNLFEDMNCWFKKGVNLVPVSINLSSFSLYQQELVQYLKEKMKANPHLKGLIQVELTESILIDDLNAAREHLNQLNSIGIPIAIDDFGTGWSNLSYLKELPISYLKIDRSLVGDIESSEKSRNILTAISSLVKNTEISIVVEGVETLPQLKILKGLEFDTIQGFIFYKPMFNVKFERLLSSNHKSTALYIGGKILKLVNDTAFIQPALLPA